MSDNKQVREYVEEVFTRFQIARQEVESMCRLTDTLAFIEHDVLHMMGIIHSLVDVLDYNKLHSPEAEGFASGFKVTH